MDKLTAEIIKEQMIGETAGHMASIPNNPILFSIFNAYKIMSPNEIGYNNDDIFKYFISELNEALQKEG